jgi:hypothetical protein
MHPYNQSVNFLQCVRYFVGSIATLFILLHATTSISVVTSFDMKSTSSAPTEPTSTSNIFPISIRQALLNRSKQINQIQSNEGGGQPQYTSAGWSNRAGTILTPVHVEPVGVYTADRPFYWNKIDVGCRATIIEMPSSSSKDGKPDLFIHSPVNLDGSMIQCLQRLGNVRYICSTNYEHVKYANMWYQNYGKSSSSSSTTNVVVADMWACPGLQERMPEIPWKGEIPYGYRPKGWIYDKNDAIDSTTGNSNDPVGIWDTSIIQPLHIDIEHNPFTQRPFFNEVIYYHSTTKTLLCTDLFWNYPTKDGIPNSQYGRNDTWELAPQINPIPMGSQVWKFSMDQIYYPFFNNFMITNKKEYQQIANHIVNVWDVETIIPAHGDIIRGKELIRSILTKYFQLE